MKLRYLMPILCLCPFVAFAQSPDGKDYKPVALDADTYTLTCDWHKPSVFGAYPAAYPNTFERTDFFVYDGKLYFNHLDMEEGKHYLHVVDAASGEYEGQVQIVWDGVEHSPNGTHFVGMDSEGTPYVSAFSHGEYQTLGYPFTITTLAIVDGTPVAQDVYTFPIEDSWWTHETAVAGSLLSGNFRVVATIFKDKGQLGPVIWGFAEWDVKEGVPTFKAASSVGMSLGSAIPVGDDKMLIYNCGHTLRGNPTSELYSPTLCTLVHDAKPNLLNEFVQDDVNATGIDYCLYDNRHFMLYGSGFEPARYAVAVMPDFPESLATSQLLWSLGETPYSQKSEKVNDIWTTYKVMSVHADRNTTDGLQFYTYTNHMGLAKYTIRKQSGEQTGIEDLVVESGAGYYTLAGIRLDSKPTEAGVYIRRTPQGVEKFVIK